MRFFFILPLFLFSCLSFAAVISGKVTDDKKEPLPFVNVYINGTTAGTTTNSEGEYFLPLKPGQYELVFKFIGYKMHVEKVVMETEDRVLNISLSKENISLQEVTISAKEDPAYRVIREAIKKRKYYLEQVDAFSCDVYIKGVQRLTKYPKKIFGQKLEIDQYIDTTSNIIYLSESVSKFSYKKPDHIKEEMISSKVSGNNRAFSYNQASDMLFNFYENLLRIPALSDRGFVSPISSSGFFYYEYKLLGTFEENGSLINKIEVTPKRKNDPVFRGIIYIAENTWRIHSTELLLTRDAQIDFVDTLGIYQIHLPVDRDTWMAFSNKFTFHFSVFGFEGNGVYLGVNSNYILNPDYQKRFFKGEEMKVNEEANKKDSTYWTTARPVPLTEDEEKNYHRGDSVQVIHESKEYLDSLDKKSNRFNFSDILFGYTYRDRHSKQRIGFSAPVSNFQFNTVEGFNISLETLYEKDYEKNKDLRIRTGFRYGFSNEHFNANTSLSYRYNRPRFASVNLFGGTDVMQFNGSEPVTPLVNTLYTMIGEQNLMKIYEKRFAGASHGMEIINGFSVTFSAEYADRLPLVNNNKYVFNDVDGRIYTSNDPQDAANPYASFARNQSMTVAIGTRIRFKQKYYTRPNQKIITGSKYPTLRIFYKKAVRGVFNSDTEYDFVSVRISDNLRLKLLGTLNYQVAAGRFFKKNGMSFMDYYHFSGNRTLFSNFPLAAFHLLDYYTFSTNDRFIEAHAEHHFGGFILNKFPLIRKLKLNEIAGVHAFTTNGKDKYIEFSFGIQRLMLRVDFVTGFMNNQKISTGFRINLPIGNRISL